MSPRTFLIYGLLAGLVAGILAFGAAYAFGEPHIDAAIAVEEAASSEHAHEEGTPAHSHDEEETEVSRTLQSTAGLATATIAIGVALGGIVGLAAAFALGRIGRLKPVASTALVAAVGFVAFALATWVKYPPNPPAVGSGDTIGSRTAAYFSFQAISVVLAIGAVILAAHLARRTNAWTASVLPAAAWLLLITALGLTFPSIDEVPRDFPPNTLWGFRLSSLTTQTILWTTLTTTLTGLIHRTTHHPLHSSVQV